MDRCVARIALWFWLGIGICALMAMSDSPFYLPPGVAAVFMGGVPWLARRAYPEEMAKHPRQARFLNVFFYGGCAFLVALIPAIGVYVLLRRQG